MIVVYYIFVDVLSKYIVDIAADDSMLVMISLTFNNSVLVVEENVVVTIKYSVVIVLVVTKCLVLVDYIVNVIFL